MSTLYLVRHGETTSNRIHALDTALPGADLTDRGREQAAEVGTILAQRCDRLHVVSSHAARAQQTAVLLAREFARDGGRLVPAAPGSAFASRFRGEGLAAMSDATATADLGEAEDLQLERAVGQIASVSEILAGDFEMRNDEDAHAMYHRVLAAWLTGETDVPVPGAKTGAEILEPYLAQVFALMLATVEGADSGELTGADEHADSDEAGADVALVSHGAVIRFVARYLGAIDPEYAMTGYLANTHFVAVDIPHNIRDVARAIAHDPDVAYGAFDVLEWGAHGRPNKLV